MSKVLGLDIGSNSIGWALLETGKNSGIIATGVRVFPEGVDRDKGREVSKNETRRNARGARRNRSRKAYRRDKLILNMRKAGLLPESLQELEGVLKLEPYSLRAKSLDEKIELFELGRVFFHINQRRGFWAHRKNAGKDDGKVKKAVIELQQKIDDSGCRTIGEYFTKIDPHSDRIRSRYTYRYMFENEFDLIWQKQKEFYPEVLSDDLYRKLKQETIFYQRPLKPVDELIGACLLEQGEKRCPRANYYARRFRILQDLNNLKLFNSNGSEEELKPEQREYIYGEMLNKAEVKFDSIRKKLNLLESQTFNLEETGGDKKKSLKGDEFSSKMKGILKKKWASVCEEDRFKINELIIDDSLSDEEAIDILKTEFNFDDEQAEKTINISLPKKYMSYSEKAICKLLPLMKDGMLTHNAVEQIYGEGRREAESGRQVLDMLDLPPDVANPIVRKALFEVRKVVNAIIREYGKPDTIKVEMAKDVHGSLEQRKEQVFKNLDNQRANEEAKKRLINDINIPDPTSLDILKYKLWNECGRVCPYTGKNISQGQLFGRTPEYQIEHIIPYSRSLDNSYMNKTLCHVHENVSKNNLTPFEAYNEKTPEKYEEILQRVWKSVMPLPKKKRFSQKQVKVDFIERQLNDTRYITKLVVGYLKRLGVKVSGTKGQCTAALRHYWGLNNILDNTGMNIKNREDHRHHAIDAAITALTSNEHLRVLSRYEKEAMEAFPLPWDNFREQLEQKINDIIVSHRVTRKVSGQLHEETSYGITGKTDEKGQKVYKYRKPLESLTGGMIDKIVDETVKSIVKQRLIENGLDPDKPKTIPKDVWNKPLYMKSNNGSKVPIKKVRLADVFNNAIHIKDKGIEYRAVQPGNNHHVVVYKCKDKKGNVKQNGEAVSLFDAVKRSQSKKPVINRNLGEGKEFICSLSKNEMFMLEVEDGVFVPHVLAIISGPDKRVTFKPHNYAGQDSSAKSRISLSKLKGYKVTVDPIGRIAKARD